MNQTAPPRQPWVLGLDLGANSLGWAAFRTGPDGEPDGLLNSAELMAEKPSLGVRIFDEGVENYGQGDREQSRAVKRRMARLQRRQAMRRARRMSKVFLLLAAAGLLPELTPEDRAAHGSFEEARDALLKRLDQQLVGQLTSRFPASEQSRLVELLPYALRAEALRAALPVHAFGRALFHLAQRRGFQSNRKTDGKSNERSQVLRDISTLQEKIAALGPGTTLGQYLYKCGLAGERIRGRWTKRSMYQEEFAALWAAQAAHHADLLTDDLRERLSNALFHQRPLRSQSGLVGICELENGSEYRDEHGVVSKSKRRRRAPECLLVSQRFRVWQTINNIRLKAGDGTSVALDDAQRRRLAEKLETVASLTIGDTKRLLGVPARVKLNLQEGGAKVLRGNQTGAALLGIFGSRWSALPREDQDAIVLEIWSAKDNPTLVERARTGKGAWAYLSPSRSEAESLDDLVISSDYMSLSRMAMECLLPALEAGLPYATSVQRVYGTLVNKEAMGLLPPVRVMFRELRNPVVSRALTELRRVVNELVRTYGRPDSIRIELARDMKRGKDDRKRMQQEIEKNEARRADVRERLLREWGRANPSAGDILRLRLHDECGGVCPYTGRSIGMGQLFSGEVDVEHIVPFSRSLDDSFTNLTLCFAEVNRHEKQNRTPFEAFGHDPERWEAMCLRMRKHVADKRMSEGKLRRFQMTVEEQAEFLEGFKSSQLNDTRHASLRAREYLMTLYGGDLGRGVDAAGRTRVQVGNGTVTALLRRAYGIDQLLPTPPGDKRADHRHHAVDAVAIALTSPLFQQRLSTNAEQEWERRKRRLGAMTHPWPTFVDDVKGCVDRIVPSFRIDNRVRGPLHAESIYSPRRGEDGKPQADGACTHIRKPLHALSSKDVEAIVDPRIRATVQACVGGRDPKKVFQIGRPDTYPVLVAKDGRRIPIYRARIRKQNTTYPVGAGGRARVVENSENHHLLVRDVVDGRGKRAVRYEVVSMMEAHRRKASRPPLPIMQIDDSVRFVIRRNDVLEVRSADGVQTLCRVLALSDAEFEGCRATDARTFERRKAEKARVRIGPAKLASDVHCRKVLVTPIGVVRPCRA